MNNMRNKIFSLLVLLMTAATGAWADDYYLVGTMNDWGASKQFQLTQNPGNSDEYMITLTLNKDAELKVIGVDGEGDWTWYPAGENYVVLATGEYTVYFRPDCLGGDDWHEHCIYAAAAPAPAIPVTDLGSNTWQFTMPDYAVVANIEYDTDLELREENVNTTVLADWDGYEANVTLTRTLQAGSWNALTLPYDIPADVLGLTVKELTGATLDGSTLNLTFEDATSIEAGKPYLVKVENDLDFSKLAMANVTVSKTLQPVTSTYVDFVPTLGKTTIEGSDPKSVLFMTSDNTLKSASELPAYMNGFSAYFQLKGDAVNATSFNLDLGEGEATGIKSMDIEHSTLNIEHCYDLQGRRVAQPKKGVYIQNGKKVVIK